jgi:hypothetical protein
VTVLGRPLCREETPVGSGSDQSAGLWDWVAETQDWVPPQIDTGKPSAARMYDYALGGKDNYPADRAAVHEIMKVAPQGKALALANRAFLVHAVRTLAEAGITQFLDLGTGIPTSPSVHEVARELHPEARVAYVDSDPVVMVHSRALLARHPGVVAVPHDLREPARVMDDPIVNKVIDFSRPVGLLMIAVLHFVEPRVAPMVVHQYVRRLVPGSYLAASVATTEGVDPSVVAHLESVYEQSASPLHMRSRAQIEELFDGLALLEPGLVDVGYWAGQAGHSRHGGRGARRRRTRRGVVGVLAGIARRD